MDPNLTDPKWLTSVAGIVAATIFIVQRLKSVLATSPTLNRLPAWAYVVLVSEVLTFTSNAAGMLVGDTRQLLAQAFLQALGAIALFEVGTNLSKPIGDSAAARRSRLGILALIVLLGAGVSGCASAGGKLVAADRAVHAAVAQTQDTADRLCDKQLLTPAACQQFNAELVPVIQAADDFNRAVRANSAAEVPAMLGSLDRFARALEQLVPDASERAAVKQRVDEALALLRGLVGR